MVEQPVGDRVEKHSIHGEITAGGVLLGRAEHDRLRPPAVDVGAVAAKGGHFDFPTRLAGISHPHDAKRNTHGDRAEGERRHDLFGRGVGGHIIIRRRLAQDQVTHAPARPECLVTCLLQTPDNLQSEGPRRFVFTHRDHFLAGHRRRPFAFQHPPRSVQYAHPRALLRSP